MAISDCHLCERKCWRGKGVLACGVTREDIITMQSRGCPLGRFSSVWPVQQIPDDYVPTPTNAIEGGCGCKK